MQTFCRVVTFNTHLLDYFCCLCTSVCESVNPWRIPPWTTSRADMLLYWKGLSGWSQIITQTSWLYFDTIAVGLCLGWILIS